MILCLTSYCLNCLNRFIKFISKNAYIVTAITSTHFCFAAWKAFTLICANAGTFFITHSLGFIFNFMGKIFITLTTCILAWVFLYVPSIENNISSPVFVIIVIGIMAYMIAAIFISLFSYSMDAMLICFLVDETLSGNGNPGKHRPKELNKFAARDPITKCLCGCCC